MPRIPRHQLALTVALLAALAAGASACSSSSTGNSMSGSTVSTLAPPATGNFSGSGPSALASLASAGAASAASASASNEAQASAFASSAAAQSSQNAATYRSTLAGVSGRGNAVADVEVQGIPKAQTGGLHAVIVRITNHTGATANYAVQIDFHDSSGKVVDSDTVGTMNLAPGAVATPVAFSEKDIQLTLVPVVAKAQRF